MKNRYIDRFDKIIVISVKGSNILNYFNRMIKRKINIIKVIPISYKEIHLVLKYSEYEKLIENKSIYEITILKRAGILKFFDKVKKNSILLCFTFFGNYSNNYIK